LDDKKRNDIIRETLTYDDYAAIPEQEGVRYELVDGVLELMAPSPSGPHQLISSEIQFVLKQSCDDEYLILNAPIDVILSPTEVRQPDLVMLHRSRISLFTRRGIEGAPDIVVEILSPYSVRRDKIGKIKSYARYGVPEYWIVDPAARRLERYVLVGQSYDLVDIFNEEETVQSDRMPCASFTMKQILDKVPPALQ
jgi:Uma2 family endonuclease